MGLFLYRRSGDGKVERRRKEKRSVENEQKAGKRVLADVAPSSLGCPPFPRKI